MQLKYQPRAVEPKRRTLRKAASRKAEALAIEPAVQSRARVVILISRPPGKFASSRKRGLHHHSIEPNAKSSLDENTVKRFGESSIIQVEADR